MRIVQVLDSLSFGGAERLAVNLAVRQQAAGDDSVITCLRHDGPLGNEVRRAKLPLLVFDKPAGLSCNMVWRLTKVFRHIRPHVIHSHNPGAHFYAVAAAKLANVPVVVNTFHSPMDSSRSMRRARRFRWTVPFTDKVVFVSCHARSVLAPQLGLGDGKCCVIQNGVDISHFSSDAERPGCRSATVRFGTIGRMVPIKAHRILIEAFAAVARDLPGATLRIVGGGPLEAELRRLASQLGLEGRVTIENESYDVPGVLRNFDVFVLSSLSEGLPLSLLEAMASGLPIVATAVGGVPELVRDGVEGWLCAPNDKEKLADALRKATDSRELAKIGHAAATRVRDRFQLSATHESYRELFESLIERKGCRTKLNEPNSTSVLPA